MVIQGDINMMKRYMHGELAPDAPKSPNDPIVFENELKYDKLSKDKQKYIKAFLADEPDQLYLKPGKIKFPTEERMRKHNEERSFAKGKNKTSYKIRAKVNKNYGETDLLK